MKLKWFVGWALLLLTPSLAAQSYLQDTIPEVVVTATGTTHLLKNVPVQTEVITRKMLDNYAGRSLEDILGGLTAMARSTCHRRPFNYSVCRPRNW